MARIEVTSRRGVQVAVVVFAASLLFTAFLLVTTGRPWLWPPICLDDGSMATASPGMVYLNAGLRTFIGLGLLVVAFKDLRGPRLQDPMLIGLVLFFAATRILIGSATSLATGTVRLGVNRCIVIDAPWSYVYATLFLVIGAVLLYATVVMLLGGREAD